jgi:hypothetical protein
VNEPDLEGEFDECEPDAYTDGYLESYEEDLDGDETAS